MVITYAVLQTRSILTGMIIHFGVNSIIFTSGIYPTLGTFLGLRDGKIDNFTPMAGFGVLFVVGMWLLSREKR